MNPLFDGLKAAAEASIFGESIVCSGLTLGHIDSIDQYIANLIHGITRTDALRVLDWHLVSDRQPDSYISLVLWDFA